MTSPEVGGRIDTPGHVQCERIPEEGTHKETVPQCFPPQHVGQVGGQQETDNTNQGKVVPAGEKKGK